MASHPPADFPSVNRLALVAVFVAAALAAIWRFHPWMPSIFYGDDLDYLLLFMDGSCATTASEILTTACYERFRPVASGVVLLMLNLFGKNISAYLAANVAIQAVTATLMFATAYRLTRGNWVASLALAATVTLSRLATYQLTQVIAPVESFALLGTLGAIYASVRADGSPSGAWRWSWVAIAMTIIAIHTHERFLVLAVWLGGVFILSPAIRSLGPKRWLILFLACVALPFYYVGYKTFVLDAHFLVGTGGTHLDSSSQSIPEFARAALLSIFGFNEGPGYLVGAEVSRAWPTAWALAAMFTLAWVSVVALGTFAAASRWGIETGPAWTRLRWPFLLACLCGFVIVPALLTIRLEQRWLFAPFVVALLIPAWSAGAVRGLARKLATGLVVVLALASILLDGMIMKHYGNLFFVLSPRFAEAVKEDVIEAHPGQSGGVALIASADHCAWTLRNGGFFRVYDDAPRRLQCFSTPTAALAAGLPPDTRIYGPSESDPAQLVDITDAARAAFLAEGGVPAFDFLLQFPNGRINDDTQVSTPTGKGVLVLPWQATVGTREALTVVSGFSYRYDAVEIQPGSQLRFGVGMIYPSPQPARAIVLAAPEGGEEAILYSADLAPPDPGANPQFTPVTLALEALAGQRVSITFTVESPGGNSTGHWVGFSNPRIVIP